MAQRVAMIGDEVSLIPFEMLGVDAYPIASSDDAHAVFENVISKDFAVVFVTEEIYERLEHEIAEVSTRLLPAITIIPSVTSARGIGGVKIEKAIERALGTKIPMGGADDIDEI